MTKSFLPSLSFLLLGFRLFAQSPIVQNIGVEQGLQQGFVTCLEQDREGFIWMGSPNTGLSRFDGRRFLNFSSNPFDPNSISGNFIYTISDLGDYLFIGTMWDGVNLYHKKTGRFFHFPFDNLPANRPTKANYSGKNLPGPTSALLAKTTDGALWVRSHRHPGSTLWLSRITVPDGFWEQLPWGSPEAQAKWLSQLKVVSWPMQNYLTGLLEDGATMCYAAGSELLAWREKEWKPLPLPSGLSRRLWRQIPDKTVDGATYWQTTDGEIWRSSEIGAKWELATTAPPGIDILQLEKHFAFARSGNRYLAFPFKPSPFRINFSKPIWSLETADERHIQLLDSTGNLWFVNGVKGIMKFSPTTAVFNTIPTPYSFFYRPFLTTANGVLSFYNNQDRHLIITGAPKEQADFIQSAFDRNEMGLGIVKSDGRDNIWIGGRQYLVLANLATRSVKSYRLPYPTQHPPNEFLVEKDGSVRIPVGGALIHLNPSKDTAISLDFRHAGLDGTQVYAIEKTADQSIWLATDDGLLRIFPEPGPWLRTDEMRVSSLTEPRQFPAYKARIKLYKTDPNNRHSLSNNLTVSLLVDPKDANILWVGTKGGGLNRLDLRTQRFSHLTTANGFPDNVIYGIVPDEAGNLWLSSNKGLIRYCPGSGKIKNYRKADGLQDDEFNTYASAKDANGMLYFGGVYGMNIFNPANIKENPNRPRMQLTGLKINGIPVEAGDSTGILRETIGYCKAITLPFHQNTITLEFAALEFTAPSKNQFRYWLKGLEKEKESHTGKEPQATYLSLPPGKYTFFVHGSNNDGIWSEKPASIRIQILPPWYRHWLAYLCYAAISISIVVWYRRLKENKRMLQFNLALEQKEARLQAEKFRHELKEIEKQQEIEWQKAEYERQVHILRLQETTQRLMEKTRLLEAFEKQQSENKDFTSKSKLTVSPILTKEDWEQFQERFSKAHPNFLLRLTARFPSLTPSETRLILLMKLGLDNSGIAPMLGVAPESVKKTRHRLRRKLKDLQISLEELLAEP